MLASVNLFISLRLSLPILLNSHYNYASRISIYNPLVMNKGFSPQI
ncbi:hypothetical protein NRI_0602 [Neorickettsia risticii str. Illinois]|uniref:Uncharacterized protein n=1 Tax=Neorickettsia risticii (strain Illinois) TaxID=434131 RepID=C6V5B1_NEORI|nr:hypothetical protein NRI_0602 [Neorickettsia risticii str. Illinois]